jgi:V8-like Glu-specific endopeptidase
MSAPITHRLHRLCLVLAAAAALSVAAGTPQASADGENSASTPRATVVTAKQTVEDLDEYWTPERIKAAKDISAPSLPSRPQAEQQTTAPQPSQSGVLASADAVAPNGAQIPTSGGFTTQAAEVSVSQRVTDPTISWPLNVVGKLLVTLPDGSPGKCTASVIVSNTRSALWTAAHCLHDGQSGQNGFYSNVRFIPAYRAGEAPWGQWDARALVVPASWADGDFDSQLDADMGSVVLRPLAPYGNIQDAMGAYGYRFGFDTDYPDVNTFGYPAEGYNRPASDFSNGEYLMYCQGNTEDALPFIFLDNRLKMDCDMGKGSSGGPFLIGYPQNNQIVGANSHTQGDPRSNDDLFSSEHANHAIAVINAVNSL